MTFIALMISIAAGYGSLAYGYFDHGLSSAANSFALAGAFWMFSQWRGWKWVSSLALGSSVFFAAFGLFFGFAFGWMISAAIFSLLAWDLTEFHRKLQLTIESEETRGMERRHLARVSLLTLTGLVLASVAMGLTLEFTFEWGAFMAIVVLIGLSQLSAWFRGGN